MEKELIDVIREAIKEEVKPINQKLEKMDGQLQRMDGQLQKTDSQLQQMDGQLQQIDSKLVRVDNALENIDNSLDRIEKRVNATFEQTAELSEFRTETNDKLDNIDSAIKDIRSDVSLANIISSKNKIDIETMKKIMTK